GRGRAGVTGARGDRAASRCTGGVEEALGPRAAVAQANDDPGLEAVGGAPVGETVEVQRRACGADEGELDGALGRFPAPEIGREVLEAEAERASRLHHGHQLVEGHMTATASAVGAGERARGRENPGLLGRAAEAMAHPVAREPRGGGGARGGEIRAGGSLEHGGSLGGGRWNRGALADDACEANLLGALAGAVELEEGCVARATEADAFE